MGFAKYLGWFANRSTTLVLFTQQCTFSSWVCRKLSQTSKHPFPLPNQTLHWCVSSFLSSACNNLNRNEIHLFLCPNSLQISHCIHWGSGFGINVSSGTFNCIPELSNSRAFEVLVPRSKTDAVPTVTLSKTRMMVIPGLSEQHQRFDPVKGKLLTTHDR